MSSLQVSSKTKQASISAVVTKADGTVIDYGVVAYYHVNPLRRWWFSLRQRLGRRITEDSLFRTQE